MITKSDRALNLNIERLCLPTLCTPLRSASQPSSARRRKPNTKPGAARFEYGHQGARKVELTGLELPTPDCQCENACAAACHTVYGVSDNACLQPVFVLMCLGRACG